jgi:YD repeat-containing protein
MRRSRDQRRFPSLANLRVRLVLCAIAALATFAAVAQPSLSSRDTSGIVEQADASEPGPQPKIVDELVDERTPTSRTYETVDGGRTVKIYPEPIHFRNANGNLQAIDNELVDSPVSGFAKRNRANRFRADLPPDASRPVRFAVGDTVVRFGLRGADGPGTPVGETMRYSDALTGVDVVYALRPLGLKEALVLRDRDAATEYRFEVELSDGLQLRDGADGTVEVARGDEAVARFEAPFAFDRNTGHGDEGVDADRHASLHIEDADTLRLAVDASWLRDEARAFPVVVDPTITYVNGSAKMDGALADTYLSADGPSTSYGSSAIMAAGYGLNGNTFNHDHRALMRFDVAGAVAPDATVFSARLGMYAERKENANLGVLRVREISRSWTEAATWTKYDGTNLWATAGGDMASFASAGVQPALGWTYWKDLRPLAERWVNGTTANNGLLVERCCSAPDNVYEFTSSNGVQAQWPHLQIWYAHPSGTSRQSTFWRPDGTVSAGPDADTASAKRLEPIQVSIPTGNLLVLAADLPPQETNPPTLDLHRWYNGNWWGRSQFGRGWSRDGFDTYLTEQVDGSVAWYGPSYYPAFFKKRADGTYDRDARLDAVLTRATDGTNEWHVTLRETGERYSYNTAIGNLAKRYVDPAGKTTTFAGASDGVSINATDPSGAVTKFVRQSANGWARITRIERGTSVYTYAYDTFDNLITYTAPNGQITRYAYEADPEGNKRLIKITPPDGSETRFTYTGAFRRQIASHTTRAPGATVDGPTTRFEYYDGRTVVVAPNGTRTTYYWDRNRRVTQVDSGTAPPTATLSGTLWDNRDRTIAEEGTTYGLTVGSTSGTKSIEVLVDGEQEDYVEQTCTTCTLSRTYTLNPSDHAAGEHVVTAIAKTHAGATQTRESRTVVGGTTVGIAGSEEVEFDDAPEGITAAGPEEPNVAPPDPGLLANSRLRGFSARMAQSTGGTTQTTIFNGINNDGVTQTGRPPDPVGAVGPQDYVEATNGNIAVYSRANMTAPAVQRVLEGFTGAPDAFDPQIVWDRQSGRFFYSAVASNGTREGPTARNYVVFGWSRVPNARPTNLSTDWCRLRMRPASWSTRMDDYQKMGVSRHHLIMGTNMYETVSGAEDFQFSRLLVVPKPRPSDTTCPSRNRRVRFFNTLRAPDVPGSPPIQDTNGVFTPVPVYNASLTDRGGYVVAGDYRNPDTSGVIGGRRLLVWRVVGSRLRPALKRVDARVTNVPLFTAPPTVDQNGSEPLDTLDSRLWQAVGVTHADTNQYRIWTSHTISAAETDPPSPRRSAMRWYEFTPPPAAGAGPIQNDDIDSADVEGAGTNTNIFNGAVSPDRTGRNAAMHYNVARADLSVQIHARSRRASDPLSTTLGSQINLRVSQATGGGFVSLNTATCQGAPEDTICRWGDYVQATPDPSNDSVIWGTNMYVGPNGNYRTQNFALRPGP